MIEAWEGGYDLVDYYSWFEMHPEIEHISICTNEIDGNVKEIYDYIKYKKIRIDVIFSNDAKKHNWHLEDTPVRELSEMEVPTNAVGAATLCLGEVFAQESVGCNEITFEQAELHSFASNHYADDCGNEIINYSGCVLPRVIFSGGGNKLIIGSYAEIHSGVRFELHSESKIVVGDYAQINENSALVSYFKGNVDIGEYTKIGANVNLSARYCSGVNMGRETILRDDSYVFCKYDSRIAIGEKSTFEKRTTMISVSDSDISIGKDCMGSFDLSIIGNDGHALLNEEGVRYNDCTVISIGDKCWLGDKSTILSGAVVQKNTIIGANSVVTKTSDSECFCVLAGNPARIVKTGVDWKRFI